MDKRFIIDTAENKEYMKNLRDELLSFGHSFPSAGGGSYYLGDDGTPWKERPRETWITCRMTHVYSIGCMLGHEGSRELAAAGLKGLCGELCDTTAGGWYAGLTADDEPLPGKQCYAHAFVILAASSALLAGVDGAKELLDKALAVYDEKFWDEKEGLAVDTWDTAFSVLDDYRGLNANMHTVEAFLAAADAMGDDKYRQRTGRIIDRVIGWAKKNDWRIPEHFTNKWEADLECNKEKPDDPFKPYGATPGHGIEWARLITQWALSIVKLQTEPCEPGNSMGDAGNAAEQSPVSFDFAFYLDAAKKLYERATIDAWATDGAPGIVYTTDWSGRPVVHDRMHWTLAEAINTSAVLYRVTGDKKYADDYSMFLEYLEDKVHDRVNGSWFHQLDSNNELLGTVWPGKSDIYHALQATIIPYCKPDVSVASAVKRGIYDAAAHEVKRVIYDAAVHEVKRGMYDAAAIETDVTALGELLIDFTLNGQSCQGNPVYEANPGGAPCNVLAMLSKLGKRTAFIGKVGNDQFGRQLRDTIEECGIDSRYLLTDKEIPTTLAFVHNKPDGDREFSFYRKPGADMMLASDEINEEMLMRTGIFHFGTLSMTHDGVRKATIKALELAKKNGVLISLDPNLREPLWDSLENAKEQMLNAVSYCDILKISDNEIQFLTGENDYDTGISKLREKYDIKLICLTMGKDGSRAYYKNLRVEVPGFAQPDTVDTTGAGDTFCGCVLNYICDHGLDSLDEEKLTQMLTFANAAAALVTTKKGAIRSMPEPSKITELIGKCSKARKE